MVEGVVSVCWGDEGFWQPGRSLPSLSRGAPERTEPTVHARRHSALNHRGLRHPVAGSRQQAAPPHQIPYGLRSRRPARIRPKVVMRSHTPASEVFGIIREEHPQRHRLSLSTPRTVLGAFVFWTLRGWVALRRYPRRRDPIAGPTRAFPPYLLKPHHLHVSQRGREKGYPRVRSLYQMSYGRWGSVPLLW